jgi:branched-subunit amino acid transport protein AzlD
MLKKYRILLIIELVAVLMCLALFLVPKAHYTFNGDSFEFENGVYIEGLFDVSEPGVYVDNSISQEAEIFTPVADLHPGSYKIYLKYLTSDQNNTFTAMSDYNTTPVVTQRKNWSLGVNEDASYAKEIRLDTWQRVTGYRISYNFTGNGYLYAYGLDIVETNWWKIEALLIVLLLAILIDIALYLKETRDEKELLTYIYALALALFTSLLALTTFLTSGHDSSYHIGRMEALAQAISQGNLPLRVSSYWLEGKGYASSLFYCDLFLFPAAFIMSLGASLQAAWKIYLVMVNMITAFVGLYCFKRIVKSRTGALLALTLYMFSAYRLSCMYVRFSVGDYSAQMFLPLVLYGLIHIYEECEGSESVLASLKRALPFTLGVSGLVLTHIQTTLMTAMFMAGFLIINWKKTFKKNVIIRLFCALAGILILNAWFIFPFLELSGTLKVAGEAGTEGRYRANGATLWQLFNLFPYGGGDSYPIFESFGNNFGTEMPFTIAPAAIGVFGYLALRLSGFVKRANGKEGDLVRKADKIMIGAFVGMLMTTHLFPWDFVEQLTPATGLITQTLMCPWRFLGISWTLSSALSGLLYVFLLNDKERLSRFSAVFVGVVVAISVVGAGYFITTRGNSDAWIYLYDKDAFDYSSVMGGEYLPAQFEDETFEVTDPISGDGVDVTDWIRNNGEVYVTLTNNSGADSFVDVPLLYYKGYRASDMSTGTALLTQPGDIGLVRVTVPAGFDGSIMTTYKEPGYWRIYEIVSLLAVVLLVAYGIRGDKLFSGFGKKEKA